MIHTHPVSLSLALAILLAPTFGARPASAQQPAPQRPQAAAQRTGAISVEEAIQLTNGWALLTEGRYAEAATRAAQVLASHPRSGAALLLAVEAEIGRGGAAAGLGLYERWLGRRTLEEPLVLRRVGQAMLREEAAQKQDQAARVTALRALAEEGDPGAAQELSTLAASGRGAAARALASMGDERAVNTLVRSLASEPAGGVAAIEALGESRSALAVPALVERLADDRPEVRGAAAQALGRIGDARAAARLTPMLSDSNASVRLRAAGALLRLGDEAGMPVLQEAMADPSPSTRIVAAEEMASRPDSAWLAVTRDLTGAAEPEIRAVAARLIAPHDPELSRRVLESLTTSPNPAVRELASHELSDTAVRDLTALRTLMKSSSELARVRGAARVLELTR